MLGLLDFLYELLVSCPGCVSLEDFGRISRIFYVKVNSGPEVQSASSGHMAVAVGGCFSAVLMPFFALRPFGRRVPSWLRLFSPSVANSSWSSRARAVPNNFGREWTYTPRVRVRVNKNNNNVVDPLDAGVGSSVANHVTLLRERHGASWFHFVDGLLRPSWWS